MINPILQCFGSNIETITSKFFFNHTFKFITPITIRVESHAGNLHVKAIQKCHLGTSNYRVFTKVSC